MDQALVRRIKCHECDAPTILHLIDSIATHLPIRFTYLFVPPVRMTNYCISLLLPGVL